MTVVSTRALEQHVVTLFCAVGMSPGDARAVSVSLVDADRAGIPSHGTMLVPLYLSRIRAGSLSVTAQPTVVADAGAVVVMDAGNGIGQTSADSAMSTAVLRARQFGLGAVTVRNAFHFGAAARYVRAAAHTGLIGIAASNTRPLMPAPGGARAAVGNNPIAFGVPRPDGPPLVLDMALSEAALGKVRLAAASGHAIPATWATDADGTPTTDAAAALAGMLLPAGGAKGFGLALMIDVLTGVLSGGGFASGVRGLYADPAVPYNCSFFFLAIAPGFFADGFDERVRELAHWIESSPAADPASPVRLPGARSHDAWAHATDDVDVHESVLSALSDAAAHLGVSDIIASAPLGSGGTP